IGAGSYGQVAAAVHIATGRRVAIKKIVPFGHKVFCRRTLRELKLLKFFSEKQCNENIIALLGVFRPPTLDSFTEIFLIQELMESDLHRVIRAQYIHDDSYRQYFMYQILKALKQIHSAGIIHCDLKPSNILLNFNGDLKVCDFGLARSETSMMSEYVATRWYRAPEIMLSFKMYNKMKSLKQISTSMCGLIFSQAVVSGR
ncbi:mitogen activated protein kinase, partial [Mycena leptocephala]